MSRTSLRQIRQLRAAVLAAGNDAEEELAQRRLADAVDNASVTAKLAAMVAVWRNQWRNPRGGAR